MLNKIKKYLIISVLCGMISVTSYYIGANTGHDVGFQHGISDFILYGAIRGNVVCRYVKDK
jgi:hypothetical protein